MQLTADIFTQNCSHSIESSASRERRAGHAAAPDTMTNATEEMNATACEHMGVAKQRRAGHAMTAVHEACLPSIKLSQDGDNMRGSFLIGGQNYSVQLTDDKIIFQNEGLDAPM